MNSFEPGPASRYGHVRRVVAPRTRLAPARAFEVEWERSMPDGLYERDALAWAEQQAALLRRLAAGERLNEAVDWSNVIEEVADVGLSELRACRSLLRQALIHLLKLHANPASPAAGHWQGELEGFLTDARDVFSPSMRQRIDLADLYADALYRTKARGRPDAPPETCPFVLDELVAARPDVIELAGRLGRT